MQDRADEPATGALAREFPQWRIDALPGGLNGWSAYWQTEDGRERRVIVEPSAGELLARLRDVAVTLP
jgi:hypothetical protein